MDLFGRQFVLLRFGVDAPDVSAFALAAAQAKMPLQVEAICDALIESLYERKLVLVRPDGHIAWRSDVAPARPDELIKHVCGL